MLVLWGHNRNAKAIIKGEIISTSHSEREDWHMRRDRRSVIDGEGQKEKERGASVNQAAQSESRG